MNFKTAAIVGAATFTLSFMAGLIGGVAVLDAVARALFWGVFGAGGSIGIELLLRNLVPDLFVPPENASAPEEAFPARAVDIVLDEEPAPGRGGFVEEVEEEGDALDEGVVPESQEDVSVPENAQETVAAGPMLPPDTDEEMPEIGAFLDAFKPGSEEDASESPAAPVPEYGDYAPMEQAAAASQEVTFDGEAQDPVILAKAVQTIMKRDA